MTLIRHIVLVFCLLALPLNSAGADQTDPALDDLFQQLQEAENAERVPALEAEIWRLWLQSGNKQVDGRLQLGMQAMKSGALGLAQNAFDDVVKLAPQFAEGWNKRATLFYIRGDLARSIADCAQVLALEPRHFGALSGLGLIHAAMGEDRQALDWFEQALAVNPHMGSVRRNIESLKSKLKGKAI